MNDLPKGWVTARLDELLAPEPAAITDGPFGSSLKTEHYQDVGPRVIRLQNIGDGVFRDRRAHISVERFEALRKHEARAGDILIAALGETLPRACLVPPGLGPAIVKADCIRVRLHPEMNPRFVSAMLNSPPVRKDATAQISGVGRPRLNLAKIRSIRLRVPPVKEQERIVEAIEEQLSRLDQAELLLDQAERKVVLMRRAILFDAVTGDWPVKSLADVAEVRLGRQRSPKNHHGEHMKSYLRAANITWAGLKLNDVKQMNFLPDEAATFRLANGDVLVSEASGSPGEVGKPAIWRDEISDCCFQNTLVRVRPLGALPEWLHLVLYNAARSGQLGEAAPGVGIHHIGVSRLAPWPIPVPPIDEQHRLVADVERQLTLLESLTTAINHAVTRSGHLRRSILERAFSGRLVPQDPNDEPSSDLLARIAAERGTAEGNHRPRKRA